MIIQSSCLQRCGSDGSAVRDAMIKDQDYFISLPFDSVPECVRMDTKARATHELWGDMITAIWYHTQNKPIEMARLVRALGNPNRIAQRDDCELWVYEWLGTHGPNIYSSETPFLVRDGLVLGIDRDFDTVDGI